jgi:hypothetical protein
VDMLTDCTFTRLRGTAVTLTLPYRLIGFLNQMFRDPYKEKELVISFSLCYKAKRTSVAM